MNNTRNMSLEDFNAANIRQLLAPIIFLFTLLVIGVPGNITVLLVYGRKYKKCVYRTIIWNLALVDLSVCMFGIPFNIARVFNYYTFQGRWVCKIFTALLIYGMVYSTNLLMLLSFHRFRQIVMPLKKQISPTSVRYFLVGCVFFGLLLASPQLAIIDLDHIKFGNNISTHVCPITAQNPSIQSVVYSIVLLTLFLVCAFVLFVTYSIIGRKIYVKGRKRLKEPTPEERGNMSHKMTKIALTISIVFAMSYIPLYFLKVAKGWFDEKELDDFGFAVLKISERLYLVNHVANPFIYALFDNQFRDNFKLMASSNCGLKKEKHDDTTLSTDLI